MTIVYPLDIFSLRSRRTVNGGDPLYWIAGDIREIREQMQKIAKGQERIGVNSYTSADRGAERQERLDLLLMMIAERERRTEGDTDPGTDWDMNVRLPRTGRWPSGQLKISEF